MLHRRQTTEVQLTCTVRSTGQCSAEQLHTARHVQMQPQPPLPSGGGVRASGWDRERRDGWDHAVGFVVTADGGEGEEDGRGRKGRWAPGEAKEQKGQNMKEQTPLCYIRLFLDKR